MTSGAVEVWRGGVNTWECDAMGHFNVRFYVSRAMEGLAGFAAELGLPGAFSPRANATLVLREHHIRFLREAHAGAALYMTAGVLEMGESEALILQVIHHVATGEVCAAFRARIAHVTADELRPFPWSDAVRKRAEGLRVDLPDVATPRSISARPVEARPSLERAAALGLMRLSAGVVGPQDCDVFGRMNAELFMGRISDGVMPLVGPFRETVGAHADPRPPRIGGAALEYRLVHFAWPKVGERYEIRSGVSGLDAKTQRMTHWLLDPDTGRAYAAGEAAVAAFDTERRKIVPIADAARAILEARVVEGLAF